ncbi:hypothetical protein SLOPH_908, partial [Spraguea lophii 42_110]
MMLSNTHFINSPILKRQANLLHKYTDYVTIKPNYLICDNLFIEIPKFTNKIFTIKTSDFLTILEDTNLMQSGIQIKTENEVNKIQSSDYNGNNPLELPEIQEETFLTYSIRKNSFEVFRFIKTFEDYPDITIGEPIKTIKLNKDIINHMSYLKDSINPT